MEVSTVIKLRDLPVSGLAKGEFHRTKSFGVGKKEWYIKWYPLGHEGANDGYCSIFLHQYGTRVERVRWSFALEVDNEMKKTSFAHTFNGVRQDWGDLNFYKVVQPIKVAILSVEIEIGFQR